jgi:hypothetical protein
MKSAELEAFVTQDRMQVVRTRQRVLFA